MVEFASSSFHAPVELSNHRLDIVRDCADLYGAFPQNVRLDFLFWMHGDNTCDPEQDINLLLPNLDKASAVAIEVASLNKDWLEELEKEGITPKQFVEDEFTALNEFLQTNPSSDERNNFKRNLESNMLLRCLIIDEELRKRGRNESPLYVPIDTYADNHEFANPFDGKNFSSNDEQYFAICNQMRRREGIVLRQLCEIAKELAKDGQEHSLAVIYGQSHTLTSIAAAKLGAPIKRRFVHGRKPTGMWEIIVKNFRLSGPISDMQPESLINDLDRTVLNMGAGMRSLRGELKQKLDLLPDNVFDELQFGEEAFILRSLKGTIMSSQRDLSDHFIDEALKFTEAKRTERRAGAKQMTQLLKKYENMIIDSHRH